MSEWTIRKLGALLDGVIDYRGRTPPFSTSGIPCISAANVKNGLVNIGPKFITEENYEKWTTRGFIKSGDVLLTTEAPVAEVAQVPSDQTYLITRRVMAFQVNADLADETFLKYALLAQQNKDRLSIISHGATVPRLYKDEILDFELLCPPLITQKKITAVLSAYDDLIENNNKRIALLEKAAEEIYREWFVRLRFPGWETAVFHKGIPQGWKVVPLGNVTQFNSRSIRKGQDLDFIHYVTIRSVTTHMINEIEHMPFEEAPGRARRIVQHGDVIWSTVRPANRAYCLILNPMKNLIVSTGFAVITPEKNIPYSFLYYTVTTNSFVEHIANVAKGAAYPAASVEDFAKTPILIPQQLLLQKFHGVCEPIFDQKNNLQKQNDKLVNSRDLLLTRLISGKLPVGDLDIQFPPSMIPAEEPVHA